ncbi:MAG TPA: aldo/keto reductase [Streptosporangiaceae bacterium]|jgi:aryl-alcohol dehydrogenase-like predicted oxidoreductase
MRGPHRFATDRLTLVKEQREDKYARFRHLFARVRPDYLAVRFNALTPAPLPSRDDIFTFAADHGASVLINKPLAQGLLTGKYDPTHSPFFGPGDHRLRKAWFTPQALRIVHDGLQPIQARFGATPGELAPVMIAYCLHRASNSAVLAGFTTPEQVGQNLTPPAHTLTADDVAFIRDTVSTIQQRLDATGEVFLDELPEVQP